MENNTPTNSGIEVNVVQSADKTQAVACFLHDLNQMLLLTPDAARNMAFLLVQCADFIEPPFGEEPTQYNTSYSSFDEIARKNDDDEDDEEIE